MDEQSSGFSLLPRGDEWRVFGLLVTGAALFTLSLWRSPLHPPVAAMLVLTPVFGLPLLTFGPRDRIFARILVVAFGFTLAHCLAIGAGLALAMSNKGFPFTSAGIRDSMALAGALAGMVGAGVSLLFCTLGGLVQPSRKRVMIVGTVLMGGVGAATLSLISGEESYLAVDAIWQVVFAYVLAKVLRV